MNVVLWILQAALALLFGASGLVKLVQPMDKLADRYPWVRSFSPATVRFIGVMEVLGTIGLVGPAATGIGPVLTPVAATGLAALAAVAAALHIRRREPSGVAVTAVLLVLTALLAWARFGPYAW